MLYTYEEAVNYISDIPRFAGKNEPKTTRAFLECIGDISTEIPTIHIAGTNGKGSVCACLCSILSKSGLKAGMFTSPHLVCIRERFSLGDEIISKEEFAKVFNETLTKLERFTKDGHTNYHPSFFEFLFFMAVIWYKEKACDVLILETGLGGRLDATNSISKPRVTVITEIGFDHMEYLGDTIDKIAYEKAGIIKPGVPVVYVDKPISGEVIYKKAVESGCPNVGINKSLISNLKYGPEGIDFLVRSRYYGNANLRVNGFAAYQTENSLLAMEAAAFLSKSGDFPMITRDTVTEGIGSFKWPGRMEIVKEGLIVDGAHNEDGILAFIESARHIPAEHKSLLYSAVSDKQIEVIAGHITKSRVFDKLYLTHINSERAADNERLIKAFEGFSFALYEDAKTALKAMLDNKKQNEMCFVAGSLYLAGEIKGTVLND